MTNMGIEKPYQPSKKEVKKAEGMMTDDQREASEDRVIDLQDEKLEELLHSDLVWDSESTQYILSKDFEGGMSTGGGELPKLKRNFNTLPLERVNFPASGEFGELPDSIKVLPSGFVFAESISFHGSSYTIDSGDELRDTINHEIKEGERKLKELAEGVEMLRKAKEVLGRKLGK